MRFTDTKPFTLSISVVKQNTNVGLVSFSYPFLDSGDKARGRG